MTRTIPLSALVRPGRFVILLVLSLMMISAAPNPPAAALYPPPLAPDVTFQAARPAAAALACQNCLYLPTISTTLQVYLTRAVSLDLYNKEYLGSKTSADGWTGSYGGACNPGTTSAEFQNAVMKRVNYFRAMVGVPTVKQVNAVYSRWDQNAAYLMSVNRQIILPPPSTWNCYNSDAAEGAKSSNLTDKAIGPDAIDVYMDDTGLSSVGHRRWILYPQTQDIGSGSVPGNGTYLKVNATQAFDSHFKDARPATRYPYVAWPPVGYVPYTVINDYWSFSYPGVDFTNSTVTVTQGGIPIPVSQFPQVNGYGENTLAWKILEVNGNWPKPAADTSYTVTVTNVDRGTYSYDVTVFDPGQ